MEIRLVKSDLRIVVGSHPVPEASKMVAHLVAVTQSSSFSSCGSVYNRNVKTCTRTEILHLKDWCLGRAPSDSGSISSEIN